MEFQGNGPEGTSPLSLKLHTKPITTLAFAHRGMNLASGSRDGAVVLWDLKSENEESGLSETSVSELSFQSCIGDLMIKHLLDWIGKAVLQFGMCKKIK